MVKPDPEEKNSSFKNQNLLKEMKNYAKQFKNGVKSNTFRIKIKTIIEQAEEIPKENRSELSGFKKALKDLKNTPNL